MGISNNIINPNTGVNAGSAVQDKTNSARRLHEAADRSSRTRIPTSRGRKGVRDAAVAADQRRAVSNMSNELKNLQLATTSMVNNQATGFIGKTIEPTARSSTWALGRRQLRHQPHSSSCLGHHHHPRCERLGGAHAAAADGRQGGRHAVHLGRLQRRRRACARSAVLDDSGSQERVGRPRDRLGRDQGRRQQDSTTGFPRARCRRGACRTRERHDDQAIARTKPTKIFTRKYKGKQEQLCRFSAR